MAVQVTAPVRTTEVMIIAMVMMSFAFDSHCSGDDVVNDNIHS